MKNLGDDSSNDDEVGDVESKPLSWFLEKVKELAYETDDYNNSNWKLAKSEMDPWIFKSDDFILDESTKGFYKKKLANNFIFTI